jgi:ribA/ribD-fused uncharacterized protein
MNKIESFQGEYRFLSNFWQAYVTYDGEMYPTVEHAYQAAKTMEPEFRKAICYARTGEAKRMGRQVPMRPDWDAIKIGVMDDLLRQKFSDPELAEKLLATGDAELVEGNTWGDYFWGVCNGEGQNWLGRMLVAIREDIRNYGKAK